jgi:hypothetical protein
VSATVLYMSISLDGFIAGPNEGPDNGLDDGGGQVEAVQWVARRRFGGVERAEEAEEAHANPPEKSGRPM